MEQELHTVHGVLSSDVCVLFCRQLIIIVWFLFTPLVCPAVAIVKQINQKEMILYLKVCFVDRFDSMT